MAAAPVTASAAVGALASRLGGGPAARLAAEALVEAECLGQPRFGFDLLAELDRPYAPAAPAVPAALTTIDAAGRFSPVVLAEAALGLTTAVQAHGLAAAALRRMRGFGRMAPYLREIAEAGYVALAAAHAPPFVAPEGGSAPVIGTNPVAFAAGRGADRLVFDLATSTMTLAALKTARAAGTPLPAGAAIDAAGVPTTRPEAAAALLPRGGRIGSLTGLMVEVLAGVAPGARGDAAGRGVFLLAIDPARLGDAGWQDELSRLRAAWSAAAGHWPQAAPVAPGAPLPEDAARRLADWLGRVPA